MPPKPWEEQLSGASTSRRRPTPNSTFGDYEYHEQKRDPTGGDASRHQQKRGTTTTTADARRWSYTMQDFPSRARAALNDVNKGYMARVAAVLGVTGGCTYLFYACVLAPWQEQRPLAKRWNWCTSPVPITLVEKNREPGSSMFVYRFALPHSYDYAGYDPVSSVRIMSGCVRGLSSLTRWYTPISHPDERGFIEFAIKDCDPGRMSARLRYLEPGDVVYLGRWMREFRYQPNTLKELGVLCTTSGASVALQLMQVLDKSRSDNTKLQVLYCHHTAADIPFRHTLFKIFEQRNKDRISVAYNVLAGGRKKGSAEQAEGNVYVGNIDPATISAALPPPVRVMHDSANTDLSAVTTYRPSLLICGPQSMLMHLCGRVSSVWNSTYWQGPPYRYSGFLKDMGFVRWQVYKFGVSTHFMADH